MTKTPEEVAIAAVRVDDAQARAIAEQKPERPRAATRFAMARKKRGAERDRLNKAMIEQHEPPSA